MRGRIWWHHKCPAWPRLYRDLTIQIKWRSWRSQPRAFIFSCCSSRALLQAWFMAFSIQRSYFSDVIHVKSIYIGKFILFWAVNLKIRHACRVLLLLLLLLRLVLLVVWSRIIRQRRYRHLLFIKRSHCITTSRHLGRTPLIIAHFVS